MKKLYLTILLSVLLIGIVSAGIGLGAYDKSRGISKGYRDELLSQTDADKINVSIDIKCNNEYCLWNAYQEGIISSRDNKIDKSYCNEYESLEDFGDGEDLKGKCISYSDYTDAEIQDIVADAVQVRLENYANTSIKRKADAYEDWGTGNLDITEKK